MDCQYLETVIQSDSVASDLFYSFDHISRLAYVQAGERKALQDYIIPGVLWQCYQPDSAAQYLPTDAQTDPDFQNGVSRKRLRQNPRHPTENYKLYIENRRYYRISETINLCEN